MATSRPRGPVPKRSDQRRRRNKADGVETVKAPSGVGIRTPAPDPEWHPIAREWFRSLAESGQAQFYERSDWATARYVGEAMSRNLLAGRFSAQLFAAVMSGMTELLTTEGARRRVRIELQRPEDAEVPPEVAIMDDYRRNVRKRAG